MRLRVGGWSVRVGGYKLSVGSSRLMIEGWMFIGRGVREDSLDGRVLDSSGLYVWLSFCVFVCVSGKPTLSAREFFGVFGNMPQIWEKVGAVPAKTSKTLSSKARWPGIWMYADGVFGIFLAPNALPGDAVRFF